MVLNKVKLNPDVRGRFCEQYILTTFQNFQRKKEELELHFSSEFEINVNTRKKIFF